MSNGDDVDARFNELVEQFDQQDVRRMRTAAARAAKADRREGRRYRPTARAHRRRRAWLAAWLVVALVATGGVMVWLEPELLGSAVLEANGPVPEETMAVAVPKETMAGAVPEEAQADAEANAQSSLAPDPSAGPFAGSRAQDYADGAAGLVLPGPRALGGLTRKQVAAGLERTRELLIAAHLDRPTLTGGKPRAFMKLLDHEQRGWFAEHLDRREGGFDSRQWVTSFAPKTTEFVTDVVKVHGKSSLRAFKDAHDTRGVAVRVNFLFVYAVQRPGQPQSATRVVAHNVGEVLLYRDGRVWLREWNGEGVSGSRCDVADGFVHPYYADSAADRELEEARAKDLKPIDPYALDQPESDEDCQLTQPL